MMNTLFYIACGFLYTMWLQKQPFSQAYQNAQTGQNEAAQENMPLEWSNLKDAEPGYNFSSEEMSKLKIWPGGVVPFYIDRVSFDPVLSEQLRVYLTEVSGITGLDFQELHLPPEDPEYRYVFFINRRGVLQCVDYTTKDFTVIGAQKVVLGYDCVHEDLGSLILALLGVPPQHNSPDRDNWIKVQEENILPDKKHLFQKIPGDEWLFHDMDYDIGSAGHYDSHKYTSNGRATIVDLKNLTDNPLGDRIGLTYTDLWKIRMLYNRIIRKKSENKTSFAKEMCPKLFKPGGDFDNYLPQSEESREEPRAKPLKYSDNNPPSRIGIFEYPNNKEKYRAVPIKLSSVDKKPLTLYGISNDRFDPLHDRSDFISSSE